MYLTKTVCMYVLDCQAQTRTFPPNNDADSSSSSDSSSWLMVMVAARALGLDKGGTPSTSASCIGATAVAAVAIAVCWTRSAKLLSLRTLFGTKNISARHALYVSATKPWHSHHHLVDEGVRILNRLLELANAIDVGCLHRIFQVVPVIA